jgi:antitoxin (DNA-binding transcriptional repressor) of toxin-antitoxin stability system
MAPISSAASGLAEILNHVNKPENAGGVTVTQKGWPSAQIVGIDEGTRLLEAGRRNPKRLAEILARNATPAAQPEEKPTARPKATKKKSQGGA